jgi:hypothetical protein
MSWPKKTWFKKGHIPWLSGKHLPLAMRDKQSTTRKKRIAEGKIIPPSLGKKFPKEKYPNYGTRNKTMSIKTRENMSKARIGMIFTEDHCRHISEAKKDKKLSQKHLYNLRKALRNSDTRKKMSIAKSGIPLRKKHKNNISISITNKWKNKEYREKVVRNVLKSLLKRPTSLEQYFTDNYIVKYELPYKYVGNGRKIIGSKNPDFIHSKGKKICVEVRDTEVCNSLAKKSFKRYKQERIKHFAKFGWKCIVFSEEDMKDEKKVVKNLQEVIRQ